MVTFTRRPPARYVERLSVLLLTLIVAAVVAAQPATAQTTITDMGTLPGGAGSFAWGINNLGQVVGYSYTSTGKHAFIWDAVNGMQDLGTLGGSQSEAFGINDFGQAVGYSYTSTGQRHAALWTIPLPALTPHQQIQTIINQVQTLVNAGTLNQGLGKALQATLDATAERLNDGDTTGACNLLQAFINQVQAAVKSGKISATDGNNLIKSANDTRTQLGC